MKLALVSVIITTYNRFDFLCRAIESVLSQSYKNIEIIVVDDYSCDDTDKKIIKYSGLVKYIRNEKNIGLPASRNVGIIASSGDYISFLDDDDVLFPNKIARQVSLLQSDKSVGVVYCGCIKFFPNHSVRIPPRLKGRIFPEVLMVTPNAIHTLLITRKVVEKTGMFDDKLNHLEDFDYWIRLSLISNFDYVDECLVIYNMHGQQMINDHARNIAARDYILEKYKSHYRKYKKILSSVNMLQASRCALMDDYAKFYYYLKCAFVAWPFNHYIFIHFFLSFTSRYAQKKMISFLAIEKKKVVDIFFS